MMVVAAAFVGCGDKTEKKDAEQKKAPEAKEEVVTDGPSVDIITSEDGSIDSIYYDAEGKITRISQTGKDVYGEPKLPIVDVFAYTATGKLGNITHTVNNSNGSPAVSYYVFSYTKEGRLYTCTYRTQGKPERGKKKVPMVESKDVIGYTMKGELLKITNGNLTREFDYDKEGHLISQLITDYDANNDKTRDELWSYAYDDEFRCTQAVAHITKNVGLLNEDTVSNAYNFEYDKKGRLISENDCGDVTISYNYNSKGCQVNYQANVGGQILVSNIKPGCTKPRNLIYRQRGTDLFNEPYYVNLSVVCLPLSWFNADVNKPKE